MQRLVRDMLFDDPVCGRSTQVENVRHVHENWIVIIPIFYVRACALA
jgi:hypothetical protein